MQYHDTTACQCGSYYLGSLSHTEVSTQSAQLTFHRRVMRAAYSCPYSDYSRPYSDYSRPYSDYSCPYSDYSCPYSDYSCPYMIIRTRFRLASRAPTDLAPSSRGARNMISSALSVFHEPVLLAPTSTLSEAAAVRACVCACERCVQIQACMRTKHAGAAR
jgi:hypothetical protein